MNYIFCAERKDFVLDLLGIETKGLSSLEIDNLFDEVNAIERLADLVNETGNMKAVYMGMLKREAAKSVSELYQYYYFVEVDGDIPKNMLFHRLNMQRDSELVERMNIFGDKKDRYAIIQTHLFLLVKQRCTEMLKDSRIQKIYALEEANYGKEHANNWILKSAMATLFVPSENR